jgi:hypothetical protein
MFTAMMACVGQLIQVYLNVSVAQFSIQFNNS